MEGRSVEAVVRALEEAGVRHVIVGGLAVVAYGHLRLTADVNLVLDPEPAALRRGIDALAGLGFRPRAPVEFAAFADPEERRRWAREKVLTLLSVFSPLHPATEIALHVEPPFDFEAVHARALRFEVAPGLAGTFVSLQDLIEMKRKSGRPQDLEDVARLEALHRPGRDRDG